MFEARLYFWLIVFVLLFIHYSHEFQIFQKIQKLEYEFPDGFDPLARDLVEKLLVSSWIVKMNTL